MVGKRDFTRDFVLLDGVFESCNGRLRQYSLDPIHLELLSLPHSFSSMGGFDLSDCRGRVFI